MERSLDPLVDRFLDHLRVERNLSANTLEAYSRDLSTLVEHLRGQGVVSAADVRQLHLVRWLRSRSELGHAATSQARSLSAVRRFFKHLVRLGVIEVSPALDVRTPARRRRLPIVPSRAEAERMVESPAGDQPRALRDRAALELLYASGLRASELCQLRLDDVHMNLGVVRPRGKGRKERVVPMGKPALAALQRYLDEGRPHLLRGADSIFVFIGNRARPLSRMTLFNVVRRAAAAAGIPRGLSPHKLRHAFATHLLQGGADLRVVQEMLGHRNIATTEIYTHVETDALKDAVREFHPLG